jgi:2-polyprenyl-3-methyl-5-hydroxy-6-metoxy-1,4-benzoquinol methylase
VGHEEAIAHVARTVGYRSGARYRARAEFLFSGIEFAGRRVLDVGCGPGTWALWAALHGAASVLGIEPEADGSTTGALGTMRRLIADLDMAGRVSARDALLQNLVHEPPGFDVVILFNVINHLDQEAVERLHLDPQAQERVVAILERLHQLLAPGADIVVADCARSNLWASLGLTNPLAPTVRWDAHQNPEMWAIVFERAGYRIRDLRWSPLAPLGAVTRNRVVQYLTTSHFVLRVRSEPHSRARSI